MHSQPPSADDRRPVVVAGFSITSLGVLRCLAGSPYAVWTVGSAAHGGPARASRRRGTVVRYAAGEDLVRVLRDLRTRFDENPVLLLTEDAQVVAVGERYPDIADDYRILLPDMPTLAALGDKTQFAQLAWDAGLLVPQTRIVAGDADLDALGLAYPYVLKPFLHHAQRVDDDSARDAFIASLSTIERSALVAQEWIPGGDDQLYFCFLLLDADQELVASFLGRKLRQHPRGSGTTSFGVSIEDPDLVRRSHAILRELGARGYCALEYKRDPRSGEFVIMEPTVGRVNQQIALTMAAGVNFPRLAADHAYGLPIGAREPTRAASWIYEFGDAASLRAGGELRRFPAALRRADVRVLLAWDDPLPFLVKLAAALRDRVR